MYRTISFSHFTQFGCFESKKQATPATVIKLNNIRHIQYSPTGGRGGEINFY